MLCPPTPLAGASFIETESNKERSQSQAGSTSFYAQHQPSSVLTCPVLQAFSTQAVMNSCRCPWDGPHTSSVTFPHWSKLGWGRGEHWRKGGCGGSSSPQRNRAQIIVPKSGFTDAVQTHKMGLAHQLQARDRPPALRGESAMQLWLQ